MVKMEMLLNISTISLTVTGTFNKGCASSLMLVFTVSALPDNQILLVERQPNKVSKRITSYNRNYVSLHKTFQTLFIVRNTPTSEKPLRIGAQSLINYFFSLKRNPN